MKTITLRSLIPRKYRSVPVWAILVLGAMVVMLVLAFVRVRALDSRTFCCCCLLVSKIVGTFSQVNHKGLHQGRIKTALDL